MNPSNPDIKRAGDPRLIPGVYSYWILNLREPRVFGPMTPAEFEAKRAELGVPSYLALHDVYDYRPKGNR